MHLSLSRNSSRRDNLVANKERRLSLSTKELAAMNISARESLRLAELLTSNDLAHQPGMEDRQGSAIQRAHLDLCSCTRISTRLLREERYQESFGISNRPSPEHWSCPIPRPLDLPIVASRFDVILSRVFLSLPRRGSSSGFDAEFPRVRQSVRIFRRRARLRRHLSVHWPDRMM